MITYKKAGVDVTEASRFIRRIKPAVRATYIKGTIGSIGGFGALFSGKFAGYRNPVLISSTDGVGTKLKIAQAVGRHDTVGIDLVAMNVNDILCVGAKPLFFLDYIACGKLQPGILTKVIAGIARGCRQAGCALIGGETAEMPGMYDPNEYDLAGFTVGVGEKSKLIDGRKIRAGDQLIGLASSGLHSNGFSLVRRVLSQKEQRRLADILLTPTRIYVKTVLKVLQRVPVRGIAHITGGSFREKLRRIIPKGASAVLQKKSWPVPPVFRKIQAAGVNEKEMYDTFNMGIGMILVVSPADIQRTQRILSAEEISHWQIGWIERSKGGGVILQ